MLARDFLLGMHAVNPFYLNLFVFFGKIKIKLSKEKTHGKKFEDDIWREFSDLKYFSLFRFL